MTWRRTFEEASAEARAAWRKLAEQLAAPAIRALLALVMAVDRMVWRPMRPGESVLAGGEFRIRVLPEPGTAVEDAFEVKRWPFSTAPARWLSRPSPLPRWGLILAIAIGSVLGPLAGSAWSAPAGAPAYVLEAERVLNGAAVYGAGVLGVAPSTYRLEEGWTGSGLMNGDAAAAEVYGVDSTGTRRVVMRPRWAKQLARIAAGGPLSSDAVDALYLALHETLHRDAQPGAREEGATDAVALDVLPAFIREVFGRLPWWYSPPVGYPEQVSAIRYASGRATGGSWRTRGARLWRRTLLLETEAGRDRMLLEAAAVRP